ncbi:hypothetical protein OTU49_010378 [Cherax quadricarinatus]|uniref:Uncharacterized protein n=1 Tax=Cherax quadricarinatus TaxID=27406 RepID=A0AAW0W943_CHEQU
MEPALQYPPLMFSTRKKNLHYYVGRVRAFWEDKVFFSDQRNVAIVNMQNLYLHGRQATMEDLAYLGRRVAASEWDEAPEFYSYVSQYPNEVPHSWPYKLAGKVMWQAAYAWVGFMPDFIESVCQNDIVYMPVSYYTGKVIRCFEDKILFGDTRNNVMVNLEDFYIYGERANKRDIAQGFNKLVPIIHAYVTKLKVLAGGSTKIIGPEPHLPTWPKQHYTSDTWLAKYAWQGELPETVRRQVGRFYLIHMNQWDNIGVVPWVKVRQLPGFCDIEKTENMNERGKLPSVAKGRYEASSSEITLNSTLIPVEQEAGIMKGSLLLADHQQGLMTSFVDIIAFTKKTFYINGEKFRSHMSLSDFFKARKIPLTAWVVPLAKPKVIFHINVVWFAVCVWYGDTPKNLENLKKEYDGKLAENLVETATSHIKVFTHFIGNITSLSFASGVLKSNISPTQTVKISFKRRTLYMYGYKFHSSCRLLDKQQLLESFSWSVLAYPVSSDNNHGSLQYYAIALWQYQYQNYITMNLFRIMAEASDSKAEMSDSYNFGSYALEKEDLGYHMSGWITMITEYYGIIQSGSNQAEATYLIFDKSVLFVDGELLPEHISLNVIDTYRQCNVYAKQVPPKYYDRFLITMKANMVWIGKKPVFLESPLKSSSVINGDKNPTGKIESHKANEKHVSESQSVKAKDGDSEVPAAKKDSHVESETDKQSSTINEKEENSAIELHTVEGVIAGSVLVTNCHQGLMICCNSIVAFHSKNFYIDGEKFDKQFKSLAEFFADTEVSVKAWVVPLKEPRIVFNCQVVCEAVCVWIGQEPADLKKLETEKPVLISLKESINAEETHFPKVVFAYFQGSVTSLSESVGLITCKTPHGCAKVAFWNKSLFVDGVRLHRGSDLQSSNTITTSMWSVLAYSIAPKEFLGETVKYCALAVWQYTDQHKIRKEILQLTSSKPKDLAFDILPIDIQRAIIKGNVTVEGTDALSLGKIMCGWIVFTKNKFGIIECTYEEAEEHKYILFHRTMFWIDGQAFDPCRSLCSVDRLLQCTLYIGTPHESQRSVCGYSVSCIASVVWMGKKPHKIIPGPYSLFNPSNLELKYVLQAGQVEKVKKEMLPEYFEFTVMQILEEESGSEEMQDKVENDKESGHKYCGKHINGRIIQGCKGGGIAQWHSIQLGGEVYIEFSRQNMFVDLKPVTKKKKISALESRPCNFYVIPVPHHNVCEYTISLAATCGWIGSKPSHIPPPGTQEWAKIDLSSVHVTHIDKSCLLKNDMNSSHPGAVSKDRKLQALNINGQSGNQNPYESHVAQSLVDNKTNDSIELPYKQNGNRIWEEEMKENHLRGTIIELHSNVGRLQGTDGSQHYFSRDHCYLYGVSLRCVELWHVLVQGDSVVYTTSEISQGTNKVQGVWVGAQKIGDVQKAAAHIYEWCKRNLVPDGARDLLVHQLEVS